MVGKDFRTDQRIGGPCPLDAERAGEGLDTPVTLFDQDVRLMLPFGLKLVDSAAFKAHPKGLDSGYINLFNRCLKRPDQRRSLLHILLECKMCGITLHHVFIFINFCDYLK